VLRLPGHDDGPLVASHAVLSTRNLKRKTPEKEKGKNHDADFEAMPGSG
jgi:hypothetical protein